MPDTLIISTTTPTIYDDLIICGLAKGINPGMLTVAKGAHFSVFDKEILTMFRTLDIAIRGEAEVAVKEIACGKDYNQILGITFRDKAEIIRNNDRPFLENLDALPFPARHLLNNDLYRTPDTNEPIAFINASRGCAGGCIFCPAGLVSGNKVRLRSIGSVADEIQECVHKYKINSFFFASDTFTWNKQWVIGLCQEILNRGLKIRWGANSRVDTLDQDMALWMKKAGCHVIGFGAESASQEMLDKMKKGITVSQIEQAVMLCKKNNIESFLVFIIGLPWETKETAGETARFIKKTKPSFIEINVAYPLPGTEFYNIGKKHDLFSEGDLIGHDYSSPLVRSFAISTEDLCKMRKKMLRDFYLRPGYILQRIAKFKSPLVALNYFRYGIRLTKNILLG